MKRRHFIRQCLGAGAAFSFPTIIPASAVGGGGRVPPSGRVNIAYIGCGSIAINTRSYHHYISHPRAQVVAVCDPNRERRLDAQKRIEAEYAARQDRATYRGCREYRDLRDLLANPDIDGVYIATGDHWHVPATILAAKAGKDMHTEKPLGLCIEQCLAVERAVRKHHRIFQYGTEARSIQATRLALQLVLNGHLGDIRAVYAWCPQGQAGGSATPALSVPEGLDYDLWLGPAPVAPYCQDRVFSPGARKGIFHIYDYSIGFIAGWGAHPLDMLQWWADQTGRGIPVSYGGSGTIPGDGLFNTITHWDMHCRYADGLELRFADAARMEQVVEGQLRIKVDRKTWFDPDQGHGVYFVGTQGELALTRNAFLTEPLDLRQRAKDPGPRQLIASLNHEHNWVDAMIARQPPVSDISSAVKSDTISHLCDIAIRTGRRIRWDEAARTIRNDPGAEAMMRRSLRPPWTLDS